MKKLINEPSAVVPEMLEGLAALSPGITLLEGETVAVRADWDRKGVALISGGGAGHEPAHAGYVGPGLLTAAVAGDVFTSPGVDAVLAAIRAVAGAPGVLLIVKNYTGDRLNFGLAAEIARTEGLQVATVVVDDDAALGAGGAGRRGIAGTVLVHKVAGAAAAAGLDLHAVKREAEAAIAAVGTMGVALTPCTVPAAGAPGFELGANEVELGLGIHGEAGVRRAPIGPVRDLVRTLVEAAATDRGIGRGEQAALLVNNLGGTPAMEMLIAAREAVAACEGLGIQVERAWCGPFLTALEMAGCSVSLMRLDAGRLARLDAPASAPAWPGPGAPARLHRPRAAAPTPPAPLPPAVARDPRVDRVLHAVAAALRDAEPVLTRMDQAVGDGDLGISLARGAAAVGRDLPAYPTADAAGTLRALSATLRRALGGSSGPFYAVALLRAAEALRERPGAWAAALRAGCDGIAALGGAAPGDRTMLDALDPAATALAASGLDAAVAAAEAGAERTAAMPPRRGRSSYLGDRALGHADPGAQAVAVWLRAVRDALQSRSS